MNYRYLGHTGLKVSEICLGTMTFGSNFGNVAVVDQKAADAMVDYCFEQGVNFFDTADVYSFGESEKILGEALKGRRHEAVIATKVNMRMSDAPNDVGLSRHHILESCDKSLERLDTDYIDLYQVHCWDERTPLEETLRALDDVVRAGKVRYIGVSNYAGWQLMKALATSEKQHLEKFVTLQALYNLCTRDLENELVPLCADQGLGILPWSPLAGGFLTGKYRRGKKRPENARRSDPDTAFLKFNEEQGFDIVDALDRLAKPHGGSVAQGAVNWLLGKNQVSSVIVGANKLEQLKDNIAAANWKFTAEELEELDKISAVAPIYPYGFISMIAGQR